MPVMGPITKAVAIIGGAIVLALLCVLAIGLGVWLSDQFEVWMKRRNIERKIAAMNTCAPEGGRKHRPF